MNIPPEAFDAIIQELERQPLQTNAYRKKSGSGQSQAFGLVNRRCLPPDYSRLCWMRPKLYKLLLNFADKYVNIPYTSITVNQNYQADRHKDKGNIGKSFLIGFGSYEGGHLIMEEPEGDREYDIKYKAVIADFSQIYHKVTSFTGNRYSLVFYTLDPKGKDLSDIPNGSVVEIHNKCIFKRGNELITKGLDHPLRKKKLDKPEVYFETKEIIISFE